MLGLCDQIGCDEIRVAGFVGDHENLARPEESIDADTTRYIDLNNPDVPATSGVNAGKNPQGIAITSL